MRNKTVTRTQVGSPEGTICRQLLPKGVMVGPRGSNRGSYRQLYKWVTWHTEDITLEMALAHLESGGMSACVVQVTRGPQGGWSGATFITSAMELPNGKQLHRPRMVPGTKDATNLPTLYYGFKQERVAPNYNYPVDLPPIDFEAYRSHLILHALA